MPLTIATIAVIVSIGIRYFALDFGPDKGLLLGINQEELSEQDLLDFKLSRSDTFRQPYLISPDSYYYLSEVNRLIADPDAETSLLVRMYSRTVQVLQSALKKPAKYILYYMPMAIFTIILGVFCLFALAHSAPLAALAAFSFTILLGVSPSLVLNTQPGLIDHNAVYILLFVSILGVCFGRLKNLISYPFFLIFALAITWFASDFWSSWALLLVPVISIVVSDILELSRKTHNLRTQILIRMLVLIAAPSLMIVSTKKIYLTTVLERLGLIPVDAPNRFNLTTELQGVSFFQFFQVETLTWLGLVGLIFAIFRIRPEDRSIVVSLVICSFYLLLTVVFQRAIIFFMISLCFFLVMISGYLRNRKSCQLAATLLVLAACVPSILNSRSSIAAVNRMDDVKFNRFEIVAKFTPEGALIVTWWDYGYFISAISNRAAFSYPGKHSNTGRLREIAETLYIDPVKGLNRIKKAICRERAKELSSCDFPLYIYLDDEFWNFHPIITKFLPADEPTVSDLINNPLIDTIYRCEEFGVSYQCGEYKVLHSKGQVRLISDNTNLHSFVSATEPAVQRIVFDSENEFDLVLRPTDDELYLIKVHKSIEQTPLFRLLIYDISSYAGLEVIYRDSTAGRMVLLKLQSK